MNRNVLFVVIFLLTTMTAFSFGGKEKEKPDVIQVTGQVRLVGSSPKYDIVISGEHEWYIAKEEMDKLHDLQHRTVTVEGEETVHELKFANGIPAGFRRELHNIRIISIN